MVNQFKISKDTLNTDTFFLTFLNEVGLQIPYACLFFGKDGVINPNFYLIEQMKWE